MATTPTREASVPDQEFAPPGSEQRCCTLLEAATDGVFVCDALSRFVYVNPAMARLAGRRAAELLGRSVAEVVAPEDLAAAPLRRMEAERAGQLHTHRVLARPDGTRLDVEVGVSSLGAGSFLCTVRDVTRSRQMERTLREREQRFRGIFDSAFQFVGLLSPDGVLLEVNRTALDLVGARPEDVVGRPFWDTPWWAHSSAIRQQLRQGIAEARAGTLVRFETETVSAAGRVVYVDFSLTPVRDAAGQVVLLIPEGRDVTEFRLTAARLRESEETFRKAFEYSGIGMALVGLDGRFQRVNRALCQILGYDAAELLGLTFQAITHPDDLDTDLTLARELAAGQRESYALEKRYVHRDGTIVWSLLHGSAVRDDAGAPRFFIAQVQDVTARKQGEAELAQRTAELARSNAELEQFAYVASHDLQEPLRAVAHFTALLAERYGDGLDERAHAWMRYAVDGARQMQALIADLLALSRIGSEVRPFTATDLNVVLADTLRTLAPTIVATEAVITADPLPTVRGDQSQLGQLLQNLLGNALKFRRPGVPPRIRLTARLADGEWTVSVRDHGIGVDPRFADRVFVIFKRLHTRDEYPGTGIGLAICKKIVERHGGRIWMEDTAGDGADCRFTIPSLRPTAAGEAG